MTEIFKIDSDEKVMETIVHSKQVALRALQNYELDWQQIRFNQLSDTCTFVIETRKDGSFLLRIHTGMSREEIDSEITWLDVLNANMDVTLPQGIVDRNGFKTVRIDLENGYIGYASLMRWVDGVHVNNGALTTDQITKEGILLAKLHQVPQDIGSTSNFIRPIWGEQSFRQDMKRLTQHYDRFLTDAEFTLYQTAAEKILTWINKLEKNDGNYGIIHGDLHQGNIVFHNGDPRPIDFGRCGFGYYLYDVANTILGIYPMQRELVIKGYESIRTLESDWLRALESFTVMSMIENFCNHAPDPRETEGLKEEQPYAQAILKHYLKGAPFLFNAIEV